MSLGRGYHRFTPYREGTGHADPILANPPVDANDDRDQRIVEVNQSEVALMGEAGAGIVRLVASALRSVERARQLYLDTPATGNVGSAYGPKTVSADYDPHRELGGLERDLRTAHRQLAVHFIHEFEHSEGGFQASMEAMNLQSRHSRTLFGLPALTPEVLDYHDATQSDPLKVWVATDLIGHPALKHRLHEADTSLPTGHWSLQAPMNDNPAELSEEQLRTHPGPLEPTGLEDHRTSCPHCNARVRDDHPEDHLIDCPASNATTISETTPANPTSD